MDNPKLTAIANTSKIITMSELCKRIGRTRVTVHKWMVRGSFPQSFKPAGPRGQNFWPVEVIEEWESGKWVAKAAE